jgi:hypothetical protein
MTRLIWISFALSLAACGSMPTPTPACENAETCPPESPDAAIPPKDVCGDTKCGTTETAQSCPQDCAKCGDLICSSTETAASCPGDCAAQLKIDNTSSYTINAVYIRACGNSNPFVNELSSTLPPNYYVEFDNLPPGCWDLEAYTTTNQTYTRNNTTFTEQVLFTWTLTN